MSRWFVVSRPWRVINMSYWQESLPRVFATIVDTSRIHPGVYNAFGFVGLFFFFLVPWAPQRTLAVT